MARVWWLCILVVVCDVSAREIARERHEVDNATEINVAPEEHSISDYNITERYVTQTDIKTSGELPLESRETESSETPIAVRSVLDCVLSADWTCVQVKTMRAIRMWFKMGTVEESNVQSDDLEVESKEGESDETDHEENDSNLADEENKEETTGGGQLPSQSLLEQLAEALVDGVSAIFFSESEEERRALVLRGTRALDLAATQLTVSGRRKGGHGGVATHGDHHGMGDFLSAIMMLKAALMAIGTGFSTLIQLKSFSFTILGLLLSLARFFMEVKQTYKQVPPPVVKVFQVHQLPEHHEEEEEDHHALIDHHQAYLNPHFLHQFQQPEHQPYHYEPQPAAHLTAHDRVSMAQKPVRRVAAAAIRSPTSINSKQNGDIILVPKLNTKKKNEQIVLLPNKQ